MIDDVAIARRCGAAWLASIGIGMTAAFTVGAGIDINLSADVEAVARTSLGAESRVRALAYIALLVFALEQLVNVGLFLVLRSHGLLLASWSLAARVSGGLLSVLGAVYLMNAAELASRPAYAALATGADRLLLSGLQATSNYTSFHLSVVLSSAALAGFFWLFLVSGRFPKLIAAWGFFASLFVPAVIVLRDFFPAFGHMAVTLLFMLSNLIALLSASVYLAFWGLRPAAQAPGA